MSASQAIRDDGGSEFFGCVFCQKVGLIESSTDLPRYRKRNGHDNFWLLRKIKFSHPSAQHRAQNVVEALMSFILKGVH